MAAPYFIPESVQVTDSAPANSSVNPSKDASIDRIGEVSSSYCPTAALSSFRARTRSTAVVLPKQRHCTMGYRHPYVKPNYAYLTAPRLGPERPRLPFLRLQGRWLQEAGFAIGTPVRILVTPGRLVLEVEK
jgi:Toxin SymE, type I toxin-antitoxin system